jgi:DNA-binding GntR family transcriptional regulator
MSQVALAEELGISRTPLREALRMLQPERLVEGAEPPDRNFHRRLTAPAGERINDLLGRLFDDAERCRRLHIGDAPAPWAAAGHREILNSCEAGDRDLSASLPAGHLARTGLEVAELLEPDYDPEALRTLVIDVGGRPPARHSGGRRAKSR